VVDGSGCSTPDREVSENNLPDNTPRRPHHERDTVSSHPAQDGGFQRRPRSGDQASTGDAFHEKPKNGTFTLWYPHSSDRMAKFRNAAGIPE